MGGAQTPPLPVRPAADLPPGALAELRDGMCRWAGVERDAEGLTALLALIDRLEVGTPGAPPLIAARLIARAALDRRESRGGHFRADSPATDAVARHTRLRRVAADIPRAAA